jgi:hypothetical protein
MKEWRVIFPALTLSFAACGGSGEPSGDHIVAQAAGFEFTAETAAGILAPQPELPSQPEVVEALADLWVQYFLLAKAAAEDTTLANIDVTSLVERQVEGEMVSGLRDRVILVDTAVSEQDLRARFEVELPGGSIRARHILLQFPEGASEVQADSVRALAASLRTRIVGGEDFEGLARQFSQDAGSAENGGDLGSFGKGQMVPAFEAAAFALAEGELSEIVETTFGLHLIRVDERVLPDFADMRDQFRTQVQNEMLMQAESTYVANLIEAAEIEPDTASFETARQLGTDPGMELTARALNRTLVRYDGGALTLGEFREWLLTSQANMSAQVQAASDDQISNLLQSLTRSELLVNQAVAEGIEIPVARRDTLATGILAGVKSIAQQLGFFELSPLEGESDEAAADRAVREILTGVVQEGREVFPLQTVGYVLKEQFGARVHRPGIMKAVEMVNEIRAQTTGIPDPTLSDAPVDTATPDTSGGQG